MNDEYNYDLTVEQPPQLDMDVDASENYAMQLQDAVNVIIHQGGTVYYDTKEAWDIQHELVSERAAIYVYSDKAFIEDEVGNRTFVPGIKVGDGTSYLIDMPFVGDEILLAFARHAQNTEIHITQQERIFWNNKVSGFLDPNDANTLILSKTTYAED